MLHFSTGKQFIASAVVSQPLRLPMAFDDYGDYGQRAIREHVIDLIDVSSEEAIHFSCNAVILERYRCHALPISEFIKAGGACKCLVMFMPQRESVKI
ncbi:MAG: hypothetical protein DME52_03435 [Verrucomicrobia bacterium]|nr:MAG: hypothetical protein DME52_03435 [Verrucomicrobiota bacterium]